MNPHRSLTLEQKKATFRRNKRAAIKLPKVSSSVKPAPTSGKGDIRIAIARENGLFDDVRLLERVETSVDNDADTQRSWAPTGRHSPTEHSGKRPGSTRRKTRRGVKAGAETGNLAAKLKNTASHVQLEARLSDSTKGQSQRMAETSQQSLKRTISDAVEGLILFDLRALSYDFSPVSDVPVAVSRGSAPKLNFSMSLDQRANEKIERTYSLISVLAKAFQVRVLGCKYHCGQLQFWQRCQV